MQKIPFGEFITLSMEDMRNYILNLDAKERKNLSARISQKRKDEQDRIDKGETGVQFTPLIRDILNGGNGDREQSAPRIIRQSQGTCLTVRKPDHSGTASKIKEALGEIEFIDQPFHCLLQGVIRYSLKDQSHTLDQFKAFARQEGYSEIVSFKRNGEVDGYIAMKDKAHYGFAIVCLKQETRGQAELDPLT